MVTVLGQTDSIVNQIIAEIRDIDIQRDSWRFRKNLERLGSIFAYEISKKLDYILKEVTTSLGSAEVPVLVEYPVLATILRAGLPMHQGMLNVFDRSENAFVSAYRKPYRDGRFEIKIEYVSSPSLNDKVLIITDPMLATGSSAVYTYQTLLAQGRPKHTHFVSVLASIQGLNYMKSHLDPKEVSIWVGAVDDELTAQAYIVPGLGDAGDLAYGSKGDH